MTGDLEETAMKHARRQFLRLAASAAALPAVARIARAQAYPSRPVRIIVGTPPGGAPDILARLMGQLLAERLGQPFVIENRPGAGGNVGAEAVVRASPDGYTLLLVGPANTINATLYEKLDYNFIRDIALVASTVRISYVMQVHPSFPAKTVPEFIVYAKTNPCKINMASPGTATAPHVVGELFKMTAGIELVHVPYRGTTPALNALLGGQAQVYFGTGSASIEDIKAGRLRAMAVTTATRSEALPNTPTIGESVPGFEASSVFGIGAPKNTPIETVDALNKTINAILSDPKTKAQVAELGGSVLVGSPADFGKLIAEETERWGKVVRGANIKPE
jgi:tripartite-type tricarboxylate transporter receptor subunit TctC